MSVDLWQILELSWARNTHPVTTPFIQLIDRLLLLLHKPCQNLVDERTIIDLAHTPAVWSGFSRESWPLLHQVSWGGLTGTGGPISRMAHLHGQQGGLAVGWELSRG